MICNIGKTERIVRLVIGLIALYLGIVASPWFYLIAIVAFVTAAIRFCPLTHLLGINTCKKSKKKK